jgi:hypothetical protein
MKSRFVAVVCRLLIVSLAFLSYQSTAAMIGTDQVAVAGAAQGDRALIGSMLSRADVARQLQSFGVDVKTAQERVAALTDDEARSLAGKLQQVPAGASSSGWWIAAIVVVALLLWWRWR